MMVPVITCLADNFLISCGFIGTLFRYIELLFNAPLYSQLSEPEVVIVGCRQLVVSCRKLQAARKRGMFLLGTFLLATGFHAKHGSNARGLFFRSTGQASFWKLNAASWKSQGSTLF